jgi:hypothetical protein
LNDVIASNLLTPSRLDISSKIPFARSIISGVEDNWSLELYKSCLKVFSPSGQFGEDGLKFSLFDYEYQFRELAESMRKTGFDSSKSQIPLSRDGTIWNGAHRTALAIALEEKVTVKTTNEASQIYDFFYFQRAGLDEAYLDEMAWEFLKIRQDSRAFVFSGLDEKTEERLIKFVKQETDIFFIKRKFLSPIGVRRNISLLYGHLEWFSEPLIEKLVLERFQNRNEGFCTTVFFLPKSISPDYLRNLKEQIRSHLPNKSFERVVHGTDSWEETLTLGEVWTNSNSISFINRSPLGSENRVIDYIESNLKGKVDFSRFLFDGGVALELHGVRTTNDLDHICIGDSCPKALQEVGDCHNTHYASAIQDSTSVILDPRRHLRWRGLKFSTLENQLMYYLSFQDPKSRNDVRSIVNFLLNDAPKIGTSTSQEKLRLAWKKKSKRQVRLDKFLSTLPKSLRVIIARFAKVVRKLLST